MKKVIISRGLPASGKTTWMLELMAKNPGKYKAVNKDSLRAMLDGGKWSKYNEKFVLRLRDHIILEALEDGKHVIIDDTNLHPRHETRIRQLLKGREDVQVEIKDFKLGPKECIARDLKRENSVGQKIIMDMFVRSVIRDMKLCLINLKLNYLN